MNLKHIIIIVITILLQITGFGFGINYLNHISRELYETHNEYIALQQKDQDLRLLQDNYLQSKDTIDLIDQSMPAKNQIIPFFARLEQIAQKHSVDLAISMPAGPQADANQKIVTLMLNLSIKGSYNQLVGLVNDLEQLDQLIIVRQVNISAGGGLTENINGTVAIKTYFAL